MMAKKKCEGTR